MSNQENYIALEYAKILIITALDQFDTELSSRAANILYNRERLNILEVTNESVKMMQCRPAGLTIDDVKAAGIFKPDYAERYGPHFIHQDNPTNHAIVDFEYSGNLNAVIWLAHEVGHAIADDIQREYGHSFRDFSDGELEEQAYFVQHIVSHYIKDNLNHPDVNDANLDRDVLRMSWDRANQYINADDVFKSALAHTSENRKTIALRALDQKLPKLAM